MQFRLLAILLFCSFISIAQEKDEDLNLQKNQILIQHDDTNKVLKLIKIGKEYSSINNDTALVLFETAHQISLKLGYKRGEVRSKLKIGNAYYSKNNTLKAEGFLKEAEEIAEILSCSKRTVETHRTHIKSKLGIKNALGLFKIAIQHNLFKL